MHWINKMIPTFFDGLDELYHHAKLGEDVQRAPAVSSKIWCLYVFTSQMPQSCKLPVLNLLTGPKSGFSPA